jgi:hypothetical protein
MVLHGSRLTVVKHRLEAIGCSAMVCWSFPYRVHAAFWSTT